MQDVNWLERTELLIGEANQEKLKNAHVLIVGLGGVGSFAAEFICRAGVGKMTIVDGDIVDPTNANRQLPALTSTIDQPKVDVVGDRLLDINPKLKLVKIKEFMQPERADELLKSDQFDFAMDCIDSITPKVKFLVACRRNKVKCVSSMGAGGKLDPSKIKVRDISKTYNCNLAKRVRSRLKRHKVDKGIRAVFSEEQQRYDSLQLTDNTNFKKSFYGTISYMPALFGLHAAAEVIKYLTKK